MLYFFRVAPLALVLLPLLSPAQMRTAAALGLEIPAPAPPRQGQLLAGAYVVGNYTPLPTAPGFGYAMQPYLRYQLGNSPKGRLRPFVQYSFAPYRVSAYGAGPRYGNEAALPAGPGFAPLAARNVSYGPYNGADSYGGLGAFSVGIPMQIGRGTAVLNLGGALLESALGRPLR